MALPDARDQQSGQVPAASSVLPILLERADCVPLLQDNQEPWLRPEDRRVLRRLCPSTSNVRLDVRRLSHRTRRACDGHARSLFHGEIRQLKKGFPAALALPHIIGGSFCSCYIHKRTILHLFNCRAPAPFFFRASSQQDASARRSPRGQAWRLGGGGIADTGDCLIRDYERLPHTILRRFRAQPGGDDTDEPFPSHLAPRRRSVLARWSSDWQRSNLCIRDIELGGSIRPSIKRQCADRYLPCSNANYHLNH